jgi:hypothetical protein
MGALLHKPCGKGLSQHVEVGPWLLIEQQGEVLEILLQMVLSDVVLYDDGLHSGCKVTNNTWKYQKLHLYLNIS